jgi:hypothetical protein
MRQPSHNQEFYNFKAAIQGLVQGTGAGVIGACGIAGTSYIGPSGLLLLLDAFFQFIAHRN